MISDIIKELTTDLPEGSWIIIVCGFIFIFGFYYYLIKSEL